MRDFFYNFPEGRLLASVRHADDAARKLASPDETILVYDDMGAPRPEEEEAEGGGQKEGSDFTDFGEMWGCEP